MNSDSVAQFYARLKAANPHPRGELCWHNPYTLLVAVILSAQATDRSVNKATASLFEGLRTPEDMLALGEEALTEHIRSIGLFRTKARNIMASSRLLVEQHNSLVPRTRASLEALPGVGRKTANVLLNIAFGEPVIAVDTHIFRVANRSGLARGKTVLAVEQALVARTPEEFRQQAHHWLILHGRYTCTARKPRCAQCEVAYLCEWNQKVLDT